MGQVNGCLFIDRKEADDRSVAERIRDWAGFHQQLTLEEQRKQAARCMDCGVPFCHGGRILAGMASGCPLGNRIPEWNDLLYRGCDRQALSRLLLTNPFPEFTGRVCPAPCEAACLCGLNQEPVCIRANECTIIELGFENGWVDIPAPPSTGKRVAVVGSGPTGLSCAWRLMRLGHAVTVYERADRPGGLLMYGIPNMKLEKTVLDRRIRWMESSGIVFKTGVDVADARPLLAEYDAVALCCGARAARDLRVEGRELSGVAFALDYLTQATKSLLDGTELALDAKGKDVLVIGGGDTGTDCVATAIRQGCRSVRQLEILPKPPDTRLEGNPWPQWPRTLKTDYGQQEATVLQGEDPRLFEAGTEALLGTDGKVCAVRARIQGEVRELPAQLVLLAMGFTGPEKALPQATGLALDARGRLQSNGYATEIPGLFVAGDMRRGQSLVVWAIDEGIRAADAVNAHLSGEAKY
ncbi:MAG TPA: glutamate synthase subunit beta [Clostridia bacterium]|nr:glutamate synthase subunit beta [Clostridia bacterium]